MEGLQVRDRYDGVGRQDQILLVLQYLGRPVTGREITAELFIDGCNGLTLATVNGTLHTMAREGKVTVDRTERTHLYWLNSR